jgi:riboflavin transporter FmnP
MEILVVIFLILLVKKIMDFIKYAANGDANGVVTQLVTWAVAIGVVYLATWAHWNQISEGDNWDRLLWGFYLGSAAATVHDFFKALSAAWVRPGLLPPRAVEPTV